MLREQLPFDERRELFGGRGTVKVWSLTRDAAARTAPFTHVLCCELSAAGSVGPHRQAADSELLIGLAGRGKVQVNGQAFDLERDRVVAVPLGAVLAIENSSADDVLEYLIVKASGA